MKRTLFAVAFLIFLTACPAPTPDDKNSVPKPKTLENVENTVADANAPKYQWVQLGVDKDIIARAIYEKSEQACPIIDTKQNDGTTENVQMENRLKGTKLKMPDNFTDITVCEAKLSDNLKSAKLAGKDLTVPDKKLERVVVMGDTGCRDAYGDNSQDCEPIPNEADNNSNKSEETNKDSNESQENVDSFKGVWDFKKTIKSATDLDKKANLVIHVGDYVYRECEETAECGPDNGRNWETWETDFFRPATTLLESTSWVFTRGNHEDCSREYRGWFLFLDPRPLKDDAFSTCNSHTDGFQVKLDGLNLVVLDSSDEGGLNSEDLTLVKKADNPTWLVTHVPLYGVANYRRRDHASSPSSDVAKAITDSNIKFLVSGHIHFFEMIQFPATSKIPPQMVAGGGATKLDNPITDFGGEVKKLGGEPTKSELIEATFTFAYVDFESSSWKITVDDQDGTTENKTFTINN